MSSMLPFEGSVPSSVPNVPPPAFDHDALAARVAMHIESLVPRGRARCLDVACGDVMLAEEIRAQTDRAEWCCVDELDVDRLPYADGEFDVALLCDVLHDGREDAAWLLAEIGRVAKCVLVKDRFEDGTYAREDFARLAAEGRLRITALDSELDLDDQAPLDEPALRPDCDFIAVLRNA